MSSKIHAHTCPQCATEFIGKRTQKYCSRSCSSTYGNNLRAAETEARRAAASKRCANPGCNQVFGPGRMGLAEFGKRRYCSHNCAGVATKTGDTAPKRCALDSCGQPFQRGAKEAPGRWATRKFCTADHAAQARGVHVPAPVPVVVAVVERPVWRPTAPGWQLRPGDAGYQDLAS